MNKQEFRRLSRLLADQPEFRKNQTRRDWLENTLIDCGCKALTDGLDLDNAPLHDAQTLIRRAVEDGFPAALCALIEVMQKPGDDEEFLQQLRERYCGETETPVCPYPGLEPFRPDQAEFFFGREAESGELFDRVVHQDCRFLLVTGPSGVGKSSLVLAGLLPKLTDKHWPWVRMVPAKDPDPFLSLAWALDAKLDRTGVYPRDFAEDLRQNGDPGKITKLLRLDTPPTSPCLLFVDQFEELFTAQIKRDQVGPFLQLLAALAARDETHVVASVRADFLPRCYGNDVLIPLLNDSGLYGVAPPSADALQMMIEEPAASAGLTLQADLRGRMLAEIGDSPGRLTLLAFTLQQLFEQREGVRLTLDAYQRLGGVSGAIEHQVGKVCQGLDEPARAALPKLFRALVGVDEEAKAVRKRAPLANLRTNPEVAALIDRFTHARARLLVTDGDGDRATVEVAHEAIFDVWPELKRWIEEYRDDLYLHEQVKQAAGWWFKSGAPAAHLWPHERLAPVYETQRRLGIEFTEEPLKSFTRSEAERLLEELENPETTHYRRAEIGDRLAQIGDTRSGVGVKDGVPDIVWVAVPGGKVTLEEDAGVFQVQPFQMARYPVTYVQFLAFFEAEDGYSDGRWWKDLEHGKGWQQYRPVDNCPAESMTWDQAVAFCRWLAHRSGYEVRLPTEWEWQQAATAGRKNYEYPWGPEWREGCANTSEGKLGRITAVGMYPAGQARFGDQSIDDLAGNVWEWCLNKYQEPTNIAIDRSTDSRVVRGGSWLNDQSNARAAFRNNNNPNNRNDNNGFRLVCSVPHRLRLRAVGIDSGRPAPRGCPIDFTGQTHGSASNAGIRATL